MPEGLTDITAARFTAKHGNHSACKHYPYAQTGEYGRPTLILKKKQMLAFKLRKNE